MPLFQKQDCEGLDSFLLFFKCRNDVIFKINMWQDVSESSNEGPTLMTLAWVVAIPSCTISLRCILDIRHVELFESLNTRYTKVESNYSIRNYLIWIWNSNIRTTHSIYTNIEIISVKCLPGLISWLPCTHVWGWTNRKELIGKWDKPFKPKSLLASAWMPWSM